MVMQKRKEEEMPHELPTEHSALSPHDEAFNAGFNTCLRICKRVEIELKNEISLLKARAEGYKQAGIILVQEKDKETDRLKKENEMLRRAKWSSQE